MFINIFLRTFLVGYRSASFGNSTMFVRILYNELLNMCVNEMKIYLISTNPACEMPELSYRRNKSCIFSKLKVKHGTVRTSVIYSFSKNFSFNCVPEIRINKT